MKTLLKTAALLIATTGLSLAGSWGNDWEAAKAQAEKENKPILINFTGSDWCGWCIKLEREVFKKKAFKDYAKDHLVLMEVDFPNRKKQSKDLKAQNKKLDKAFGVEGYPTVYLADASGKKISGDIGYRKGGPDAYVAYLKSLLKK